MLQPVKKTRLYENIVNQILELIRNNTLKPGDKLPPERKLVEQLGVSRTAIREALRSLEIMGYIESNVGGGTFVRSVSLENIIQPFTAMFSQDEKLILDLIEVRMLLETEMASICAQNITDEGAASIKAALDQMEAEIEQGGHGIDGDAAFHNELAKIAGNLAMSHIFDMCRLLLKKSRETTLDIPGQPRRSLLDHYEIFDAIVSKNSKKASASMRAHLSKAYDNYRKQALIAKSKK